MLILLGVAGIAQKDSLITHIPWKNTGKKCAVTELKECIIITEDNVRLKDVKLVEVYADRIVFIRDGSLHDISINKIKKLYVGKDKMFLLKFSPETGPYIETNYY